MEELRPGDRIESLVVEALIGRGAFGRVYRARDEMIGRPVALKVVQLPRHATPPERARVLREARAVGRLSSPHIVTLFRVHEDEAAERWIFEMEYVGGGTLARLLEPPHPLSMDQVTAHAAAMATALDAAHRAGIVHGDVKPGNVLVDGAGVAKLADFGLSRLVEEASLSQSSARFEGTPLYMAPEVILGGRATPASDIWSFGVCLYRMLAGHLPFDGGGLGTLFQAIQHADPRPLPRSAPRHLAALALRCLEKAAERRPASFEEIRAALSAQRPPADAPRRDVSREAGDRLLGRDRELARIDALISAARGGAGGCLVVTGPQGIGCSALVREALARARAGGFACIAATVTPLRGVLRPLLEATRACIEQGMAGSLAEERFGSAGSIAGRLLDEEASVKLESREQTLWVLEQILGRLAGDFRLIAVLEDVHEAQEDEAKAVEYLAQRVPAAGGVLMVTSRLDGEVAGGAGGVARLTARPRVVHLPLGALSREDAYRQLQQLADAGRVAAEVARRIHAVAQGNPLYAAELYRELSSSDAVVVRDGTLQPGPAWARADFPGRLADLCGARLRRLSEEQRELLDVAAVDGTVLDGELLAALLDQPLITVLRRLQQVRRQHGFLEPDRHGFRFSNALFREALYGELAPGLRRELHLQIARHLEGTEAAARDPERVGLHWERAGDAERARPHLLAAAQRAARRQELERAIDLARRGGIHPDTIDDATAAAHAGLLIPLADCYYGTGRTGEGEHILRRVCEAAQVPEGQRDSAFTQLTYVRVRRYGVTPEEEAGLEDVAARAPPGPAKGQAHYILGTVAKHRGHLDEAERRFRLADDVFRETRHDAMHSSSLDQLASVALRRGRLQEARALYFDAARVATHAGRRTNSAASRVNAALASMQLGRLSGVAGVLQGCITELDVEGAENMAAHARILLSDVLYAEGDLAGAERIASGALERLERSRFLPGLSTAHAALGRLRAIRGDLHRASEHTRRGLEIARQTQARDLEAALCGLAALISTWSDARENALAMATQGLDAAQAQGAPAELVYYLAECALFGLVAPGLESSLDSLKNRGGDRPFASCVMELARAILGHAPIREVATALRECRSGEHRACLRLAGQSLAVVAAEECGDRAAAFQAAHDAHEQASKMDHRWFALHSARALARLAPTSDRAEEWERRATHLAAAPVSLS